MSGAAIGPVIVAGKYSSRIVRENLAAQSRPCFDARQLCAWQFTDEALAVTTTGKEAQWLRSAV
jgi:hypothetical protein